MRFLALLVLSLSLTPAALGEVSRRTPVNQVFQFAYSAESSAWPDGSTVKSSVYLWIPERCERVRGLLILGANVPEHMLVGHESIREVCRQNDLAIVWAMPSFMNFKKDMPLEHASITAFLQQLLDGLAQVSGYDEIASAPWLPIGESGHLLMVDALVEHKPDRVIAGVWLKNSHLPPTNRTVPALVVLGSSQEWGQDKIDIRERWSDVESVYQKIIDERTRHPGWPISFVLDGHSGHFDCSEQLVSYLSRYIAQAVNARLPDTTGDPLRSIDLSRGFVVDLSRPGRQGSEVQSFAGQSLPWYFDSELAEEARSIASINWSAQTQFIGFLDDAGDVRPFDFNGIQNIKSISFEDDGVTFTLRARLLEKIPATFQSAGEALATTPGAVNVEWLCGPIEPLGEGRFRIALDRTWNSHATYLLATKQGDANVRSVVQPIGVQVRQMRNNKGTSQKITFEPIADVRAGTESIELKATSDAGMPVRFYVVSGPAVIEGDRVRFTPIPLRSKWPVRVEVAAWQWGRSDEPAVKAASEVRRSFYIIPEEPR